MGAGLLAVVFASLLSGFLPWSLRGLAWLVGACVCCLVWSVSRAGFPFGWVRHFVTLWQFLFQPADFIWKRKPSTFLCSDVSFGCWMFVFQVEVSGLVPCVSCLSQ